MEDSNSGPHCIWQPRPQGKYHQFLLPILFEAASAWTAALPFAAVLTTAFLLWLPRRSIKFDKGLLCDLGITARADCGMLQQVNGDSWIASGQVREKTIHRKTGSFGTLCATAQQPFKLKDGRGIHENDLLVFVQVNNSLIFTLMLKRFQKRYR